MDSSSLKPHQVDNLRQHVRRELRYLSALCSRMQQLRFPNDDPLCRAALDAHAAMERLHMACQSAEAGAAARAPRP